MKKSLLILFVLLFSTTVFSQSISKRVTDFNLEKKVAIQGYDPVAYFVQKKAVKGKSTLASTYDGVVYHFSSQTNKDLFLKNLSITDLSFLAILHKDRHIQYRISRVIST